MIDMNFTIIASIFAGISGGCFAWLLFDMLQRLHVEKLPGEEDVKRLPIILAVAVPFTPNTMFIVRSSLFAMQRDRTMEKLVMAGYEDSINAERFLGARIVLALYGLIFLSLFSYMGQAPIGIVMTLLLLAYPNLWLNSTIKRRHLEIQKALPTVLDLLTLSVEAGKDFLTGLRDIIGRRRRDALTEELDRAVREIQLGKQRRIALKEMAQRVRQPDLTAVVNAIVQADELGVSIGQLLRIQGDQFRSKRFQRAEKLANEAPVKILFPVVIFIFPAVILLLMTPILMQTFKVLFK